MARVSESIDIRVPCERVFAAITDPRRTMEWNPNVIALEDLSDQTAHQGTSWIQTAMIAGRATQLHCRIVGWQPPHVGVLDISGDQKGSVRTECREVGGATRVVQTIDFTPPGGLLGAMAGGLIARQIGSELSRSLRRQRETLEREWRESGGS